MGEDYCVRNSDAQEKNLSQKEVSKQLIIEMVKRIDDSDEKFLRQIYTILKRHLERMYRSREEAERMNA